MITSLDGHKEDEQGNFDWGLPDEEVLRFINDLQRPIGTHPCGRRMFEVMKAWETDPGLAEHSGYMRDFTEIWQAANRWVSSRSLQTVSTSRTRIVRQFGPGEIDRMIASAGSDLSIGGSGLADESFQAGLVDECHL